MFLYREFNQELASPTFYDSARGGADFILAFPNRKIPIEIGHGRKEIDQASLTLEKIQGSYGLVICNSDLVKEGRIIKIPLQYFLLI